MEYSPNIARLAALIGDPARAMILMALMDGRALTARELSDTAGVTPQTASSHLKKLHEGNLVALEKHGRHRFYRLASAHVGSAIEALGLLSQVGKPPRRATGPRDTAMRRARTCYDHLAGELGVRICDRLIGRGFITEKERDYSVTKAGASFFADLAIDLDAIRAQKRVFARQCLDWSERRYHMGGALGAAFYDCAVTNKWIRRRSGDRTVTITPPGQQDLGALLGIDFP